MDDESSMNDKKAAKTLGGHRGFDPLDKGNLTSAKNGVKDPLTRYVNCQVIRFNRYRWDYAEFTMEASLQT